MAENSKINRDIAQLFRDKGNKLEVRGGNHAFRALSYYKAADAIDGLERGLDDIYIKSWLAGLQKINGIGNRLAHDIERELKKRGITR